MKILVIEDDIELGAVIEKVLAQTGFSVDLARNGQDGLERALATRYGLIVLDLMLPKMDGMQVCAQLRERRRTTPILMVTARDAVTDRVRGLECGADDYLPKPFDIREFLARIHALLRRDRAQRSRSVRIGLVNLDTRQRSASVAGVPLKLSRQEYAIFELLATNLGRIVPRVDLENSV
jgi:DNA-binding response OmpR family regulator